MIKRDTQKHMMIFECCRIVKGFTKSLVYDLQRGTNRFVPNDLAELLLSHHTKTIEEICSSYPSEHHNVILENISMLIAEDYLFLTDTPERFPSLSLQWDEPCVISNAIIEYGNWANGLTLDGILTELLSLGCKHLELRIYLSIPFSNLLSLIRKIHDKDFASIDLISRTPINFKLDRLIEESQEISQLRILLFDAEKDMTINNDKSEIGKIVLKKKSLENRFHCGIIGPNNFVVNVKMFTESIQYNSCLNRKISIDTEGNIKNCPSMTESYGNIEDTTLTEAKGSNDFTKYWNISKDKITACKDCEFRYMCHDCRAYTENPDDTSGLKKANLSKPLKCGYDPYSGEWSEWSTNPLKHEAVEFYGMQDLVLNVNKK